MTYKEIPLNTDNGEIRLSAYLLDADVSQPGGVNHPAVLMLPGAGDSYPTDREAESLALDFSARGFHTFLLHHPVASSGTYTNSVLEGFSAIACIRDHAEAWHVDAAKVAVCGFFSGGQLAAGLLTQWKDTAICNSMDRTPLQLRADAGILCNPLFSLQSGEEPSFSLVDNDTPPLFLWCTQGGANSTGDAIAFAAAMLQKGREVELHVLGSGHSLEPKDGASSEWFEPAQHWLNEVFRVGIPGQNFGKSLPEKAGKPAQYYKNIFNDREGMFRHSPFSLEQDLVRYVVKGNDQAALDTLARISLQGSKAVLANDTLRSAKNSMICSCTFLTRAAIQAGVPDEEAFALSDAAIQHLESLDGEKMVLAYEATMLLQFIGLVKMRQDKNYSTPVRKAMHFIASNLEKPFQLAAVAEYAGVHPNYLSRRFKQETGSTLSSYTTVRKIHEATYFVQHTDYSMADIAVLYGFSSQSHFNSAFKKVLFMSPGDFRNRSRNS
ncbi:MAG: helix-turn-helix domain-containing protein [Anaerolineaceae bacterium]